MTRSSGKPEPKPGLGEGIGSLKTSNIFRNLNFELYVKPNKFVMVIGGLAFTGCVGYMVYMRQQWKNEKVYTALNDDDELVLRKKASRWE